MFCPNCGAPIPDDSVLCESCGSKLKNTEPAAPAAFAPPVIPVAPAAPPIVAAPRSSNPAVNALKNIGASPLFLIATIAFTVGMFFSFISLVGGGSSVAGYIDNYLNRAGIENFNSAFDSLYGYRAVFAFLLLIPTVIYATGMWITFVSASGRGSDSMSTSGLTMIKTMQIISIVFRCILFAIVEIVLLIVMVSAANARNNDYNTPLGSELSVLILCFAVVYLIAFILKTVYRAKIVSSIGAVKKTVSTGNSVYRVSGFVGVMNFIIAFSSLSFLFFGGLLSVISTLCDITALVCFGLLLFKFNAAMRRITPNVAAPFSYQQPQYPNGGYGRM